MCLGVKGNKEKIGNLMVLLAQRLQPLYHTKLIKLLYLIDEEAVKDNGVPLTWLDYNVWQYGPVAPEVYYIKDNNSVFSEYVSAKKTDRGTVIEPQKEFDNGEFTRRELRIIEQALEKYGNNNCERLVDITHTPQNLWSNAVKENNLDFSDDVYNISNIVIDFTKLINNDNIKLDNYTGARETMCFSLPLNSDC